MASSHGVQGRLDGERRAGILGSVMASAPIARSSRLLLVRTGQGDCTVERHGLGISCYESLPHSWHHRTPMEYFFGPCQPNQHCQLVLKGEYGFSAHRQQGGGWPMVRRHIGQDHSMVT